MCTISGAACSFDIAFNEEEDMADFALEGIDITGYRRYFHDISR